MLVTLSISAVADVSVTSKQGPLNCIGQNTAGQTMKCFTLSVIFTNHYVTNHVDRSDYTPDSNLSGNYAHVLFAQDSALKDTSGTRFFEVKTDDPNGFGAGEAVNFSIFRYYYCGTNVEIPTSPERGPHESPRYYDGQLQFWGTATTNGNLIPASGTESFFSVSGSKAANGKTINGCLDPTHGYVTVTENKVWRLNPWLHFQVFEAGYTPPTP